MVRAIYKKEQPPQIEKVDDATSLHQLSRISQGNFEFLYEQNISNIGQSLPVLKLIHTKFNVIDQFASGMSSVSPDLVKTSSFNTMQQYLTYGDR